MVCALATVAAPQVKHAQSLADHCSRLEAALSRTRSKLPRVCEVATQTDHSFLSDVHPERKAASSVQRYVEHDAYVGALWQPTDADQKDSHMVRVNAETAPELLVEGQRWYMSVSENVASLQGYKVAAALRKVLWETIRYGRSLYGRPCHDLGSFFSAVRLYVCINAFVCPSPCLHEI